MKNFFISYNQADKEWAQWLDWQLRSKGYTTFTQFGDIPWGANFVERMDAGLKEAERMILVLSPDFVSSVYTEAEWTTIFTRDPGGHNNLLLPIQVRECELKGLLAARVFLDLWEHDEPGARDMLASGLTTLKIPATGAMDVGPPPQFPYLRYDFFIEFCDSEAARVDGLAAQLVSLQKKVWRDLWTLLDRVATRKKNPPASLRFGCRVLCSGDGTPDYWIAAQIRDALDWQRADPNRKVLPVVFGSTLNVLQQAFAEEIFFWADGSNALRLLLAAASGVSPSVPQPVAAMPDPHELFLQKPQKLAPLLNPTIVDEAQRNLIKELQRETYGGR